MVKIRICKEKGCNNSQTTQGYCRLHYLRNWKKLKAEKQKSSAERLNRYIEAIVAKHPDRYIDVLKKEIRSKNFEKTSKDDFTSEMDDIYKIFSDAGFEDDVEKLIRDLKVEDDF